MKIIYYFLMAFSLIFCTANAYSDPILISSSSDMNKVIFDGKWSFDTEWKRSSLNELNYDDGTKIELRSAHQDNFIYVLVDVVSDSHPIKQRDNAMICIDKNNNKTSMATSNDYCFLVTLGGNNPIVLQGGSPLKFTSNFKTISNPDGFLGVGGISDKNDRYNNTPHPSYEFRIPTEIIGRSNEYGFYLLVFDQYPSKFYSWPIESSSNSSQEIPHPDKWGDIISPDKTLPEFTLPIVGLISSFVILFFVKFRITNAGLTRSKQ